MSYIFLFQPNVDLNDSGSAKVVVPPGGANRSMSPDVVETYSSDLRPNEDEIQLLRLKLEEAQCKNRVIEEEMLNLKSKVIFFVKLIYSYIFHKNFVKFHEIFVIFFRVRLLLVYKQLYSGQVKSC